MKQTILANILVLILLAVGFGFGYHVGKNQKAESIEPTERIDTLLDTVFVPKPYPVKQYLTGEIIHDTLPGSHDSIPVAVDIPISRSVYQDSNYRAVVSGYKAKLDSMDVYGKIITKTRWYPKMYNPKWSVGIVGGYGASSKGLSPFVGIGVSYNIYSW